MYDLRHFIHTVEASVVSHNLGLPGAYCRWIRSGAPESGMNPYGCADAANILYTTGRFPGDPQERQAWIGALQGLQDPESGLYNEPTHHPIHTTAHCIAALELFDARPLYPLTELHDLLKTHEISAFLATLNWRNNPWNDSHRGAGVYAALVLAGEVNLEWEERYFTWLWDESDPQTGLPGKDRIKPVMAGGKLSLFPSLAGAFHYLFNQQYARRPLRYPEKLVDTCLDIYHSQAYPLGESIGFAEIDWVYCLNRAVRQCGHRFGESRQALEDFSAKYIPFLLSVDPDLDAGFDDLHLLFGALCCLAELQQALPGQIRTQKPLRLVLDRRPFI